MNSSTSLSYEQEYSTPSCNEVLEITFQCLNLITGAITLSGNLLVFAAIVSSSRLRQRPMNQFLTSLAVTDIIMGSCISPGYSIFCVGCMDYSFSKSCWLMKATKDIALASSIYNLLAISADRCLAVYWPLRYATLMTKGRVISILSSTWGISFIIAAIRIYWEHTKSGAELDAINSLYNNILLICVLLLPSLVISVINVKIILTIRDQARQVFAIRNAQARSQADTENPDVTLEEVARKRKGTLACALVVIVFVISWIPRICFNIQFFMKGDLGKVDVLLQKLSMFFFGVQSSINPFIYSLLRADFRQAARKLLRMKNSRNVHSLVRQPRVNNVDRESII
ncbi:histamine H2 receptor-like [Montipora capricornis]|uniref:histamine H2 receptor-like n=1 Tax=Montipora capricornis TaxID=246305 RepID=UPI0035F13068